MRNRWKIEKDIIPYSVFIKQLAEQTGLSIKAARNFADTLVDIVTDEVAEGNRVRISGLGSFYPVGWEARDVDFGDGPVHVDEQAIVMYNASRKFRKKVKDLK